MSTRRLALSAALAVSALAAAAAPALSIPPPPAYVVLTGAFYQALEADDEKALARVVAPTAKFHVSDRTRETQTLAQFRARMTDLYDNIPDVKRTTQDIFQGMDRIAVRYRLTGTYAGLPEQEAPTGKKVDLDGVDLFRVEGGRIVELWHQLNTAMFAHQLGLKVAIPGLKPTSGR